MGQSALARYSAARRVLKRGQKHQLWVTTGGSEGFNGTYAVDIGLAYDDFGVGESRLSELADVA